MMSPKRTKKVFARNSASRMTAWPGSSVAHMRRSGLSPSSPLAQTRRARGPALEGARRPKRPPPSTPTSAISSSARRWSLLLTYWLPAPGPLLAKAPGSPLSARTTSSAMATSWSSSTANTSRRLAWYNPAHMNDKPKVTPKDFFLWAGAMITLYASVAAFISLLFSYLNYVYPDALTYFSGGPYSGGVSYEMASLIVLFPIFLAISHLIIKSIKADPTRESVWVRRWAIYLTLFAAAAMIAGVLITLIMYFFNGDTTLRFVLKVFVVLLIAVGIFLHYVADLRGYWYR